MKISSIYASLFLLLIPFSAQADEGLWTPLLLQQREADMQAKGLKIPAEAIYSVNQSSLKDAIVRFGSGCTAEFISANGLLLTNHHCGYDAIQKLSTLQDDLLRRGFWAQNRAEERPCPGLTATLLIRMEDVSDRILTGIDATSSEAERQKMVADNSRVLCDSIEKNTPYKADIKAFFYGNQYVLFVNEVFTDLRLVAAPPSNIGKFGGDSDNWIWPRHTGDFSLFRVYVDQKPYQARKHLTISTKGYEKDDFTFVFGYPGRTQEYLTSYAVRLITEVENPIRIAARTQRLEIIHAAMASDPYTRIQYSAKAASIANGWKKWQGENKGIQRLQTLASKSEEERLFQRWADTAYKHRYAGVLKGLYAAYQALEPVLTVQTFFNEHVLAPEIVKFAYQFDRLIRLAQAKPVDDSAFHQERERLITAISGFHKDYNVAVDKQIFKTLSKLNKQGEQTIRFIDFPDINFDRYVDQLYAETIFCQGPELAQALYTLSPKMAAKWGKDLAYEYAVLVHGSYRQIQGSQLIELNSRIDSLQRLYMQAQILFHPEKVYYPDANSTLRVAYGRVSPLLAADAVDYHYYTTLAGVIEKEDPAIYDYVVDPKLKSLYQNRDFGPYANAKGEMPVAFIASNHTTGGNSGSPVLNAHGELIGLNFDRNWQGTMSDLDYDSDLCRNIALDIRYCLFLLDKMGAASWLIDEMTVSR